MADNRHQVVIVGGGFAGLTAAVGLRRAPVQITLVDRRNFHLFQPLLYQVATGGLSPANIAAPLRAVLKRQANVSVLLGEVVDIDVEHRQVSLADGELAYDTLVLATGATHHYFGHPEWEELAPGLKTIEDATEIRRRVLRAFEAAERCDDPAVRNAYMTFVIVGAGPTGVEMAGAIAELAHMTLKRDFRRIDPRQSRIILIEGTDRVLPPFQPVLSAKAKLALNRLNVQVWTNAQVIDIQHGLVVVRHNGEEEKLATPTVVWAAGVAASPLGRQLAGKANAEVDRHGRVVVGPELSLPNHPEVFVIGDLAAVRQAATSQSPAGAVPTLPGVAPVAMQEGRYVADVIRRRLLGHTVSPFVYHDKGTMATIGRNSAVADLGWIRYSGYLAWLTWLFIHLLYLVQFQSRVLVLIQWAWSYVTRNRAARLITNEVQHPIVVAPQVEQR